MNRKYTVKDDTGTYEITEHEQERSTAELIEEARKLIEYNKRQKEIVPKQEQKQPTVKDFQDSMEDAQIMASLHKNKPVYKLPKSIFDAFDY